MTETLIVLAVTTAMFGAVVILFSGRQARTEFNQAVRDFEGRLESIISEVVTGHYRSFSCSVAASNPPVVTTSLSPNPASNEGCIFIGKGIEFPASPRQTRVSTLVGRRTVSALDLKDVESLAEARPVIAPSPDHYNHTYQLQVTRVARPDSVVLNSLAFVRSFSPTANNASGSLDHVKLYGATTSLPSPNIPINLANFTHLTSGATICLRGQNGQRAEITIGQGGGDVSLYSKLDTQPAGVCNV